MVGRNGVLDQGCQVAVTWDRHIKRRRPWAAVLASFRWDLETLSRKNNPHAPRQVCPLEQTSSQLEAKRVDEGRVAKSSRCRRTRMMTKTTIQLLRFTDALVGARR